MYALEKTKQKEKTIVSCGKNKKIPKKKKIK